MLVLKVTVSWGGFVAKHDVFKELKTALGANFWMIFEFYGHSD